MVLPDATGLGRTEGNVQFRAWALKPIVDVHHVCSKEHYQGTIVNAMAVNLPTRNENGRRNSSISCYIICFWFGEDMHVMFLFD